MQGPLLLLLATLHLSFPLSCMRCNPNNCEPKKPEKCKSGELTSGICGCCKVTFDWCKVVSPKVCAQGVGDSCGGWWGQKGRCASNLTCASDEKPVPHWISGTCEQINLSKELKDLQQETKELRTTVTETLGGIEAKLEKFSKAFGKGRIFNKQYILDTNSGRGNAEKPGCQNHKGEYVAPGSSYSNDGCNKCFCTKDGKPGVCTSKSNSHPRVGCSVHKPGCATPEGRHVAPGATYRTYRSATDGCNSCKCGYGGAARCTR